jgi:ATP-dependent DNA helicase RecQ
MDVEARTDGLLAEFGYGGWRPGQREAVAAALTGKDALVVMPTGGGKSLCYQLPGLSRPALTIVVSPLIALMRDQYERLAASGHPVAMVSSGMSGREVERTLARIGGDVRIVYCAPERFWSQSFLDALSSRSIDLLAIDEAHCMSEWGHDFRPDYMRLGDFAARLGKPPLQALTATASPPVRRAIVERLGMRDPVVIVRGFDRPNLHLAVRRFSKEHAKMGALVKAAAEAEKPGIVYIGTRQGSEDLAVKLQKAGVSAGAYHAGLEKRRRSRLQDQFMDDGLEVMVATTAFGMGIDKPNVRFVFHAGLSDSIDSYYQEVGRAGRDEDPARACIYYCPEDQRSRHRFDPADITALAQVGEAVAERGRVDLWDLVRDLDLPRHKVLEAMGRLEAAGWLEVSADREIIHRPGEVTMADAIEQANAVSEKRKGYERSRTEMVRSYTEHTGCRRDYILGYFGEQHDSLCGNCDNCDAGLVAREAEAVRPFSVGSAVIHPKWGPGEVQRYDGDRIITLFDSVGYRTLDLKLVVDNGLLQTI